MKEFKPPHSISTRNPNLKSVFLAGSIEMGTTHDWQNQAASILTNKNITVFNPRREEWDASWKQRSSNPQFNQQVNWELLALDTADHIIMYFAPDTKSPISLLELGLYANSGKLLVCCLDEFWRKGNVEIVCEKYNIPMFEDLSSIIRHITNNS